MTSFEAHKKNTQHVVILMTDAFRYGHLKFLPLPTGEEEKRNGNHRNGELLAAFI